MRAAAASPMPRRPPTLTRRARPLSAGGCEASFLAAVYQIDEDDAKIMLDWVQVACQMRDEVGYQQAI